VRRVPAEPTATNVPFAWVTPIRKLDVSEVLEVHVIPSEEVRMIPPSPTATKVPSP
jgi:hypothetical protein